MVYQWLDLPKEIRMLIYFFIFANCQLVWNGPFATSYTELHGSRQPLYNTRAPQWFSILLTCKSICREARDVLFKRACHRLRIADIMLYRCTLPDNYERWSHILNNLNKAMPASFLSTVAPHIKIFSLTWGQRYSLERLYEKENPPLALLTHFPQLEVLELEPGIFGPPRLHITLQGNMNMSELCILTDAGKAQLSQLLEAKLHVGPRPLSRLPLQRLAQHCRAEECEMRIYVRFVRMRAVNRKMVQPSIVSLTILLSYREGS
jgi:hypothetical protein